jgi:hypothetical protein
MQVGGDHCAPTHPPGGRRGRGDRDRARRNAAALCSRSGSLYCVQQPTQRAPHRQSVRSRQEYVRSVVRMATCGMAAGSMGEVAALTPVPDVSPA